jgi:hypothetical protein
MSRHLPPRPNLEHLKKQAKTLLRELKQHNASAKLADAQHAVAVKYGFATWANLKTDIDARGCASPFVGMWHADTSKSPQLADPPWRQATLTFDAIDHVLTITQTVIDTSGREERGTSVIRTDGERHPSAHGYALSARWRGAHVIEAVVDKDGRQVSRVTYEASADGKTLTVSATAAAHDGYPPVEQVTVFDRVSRDGDTPVEREPSPLR